MSLFMSKITASTTFSDRYARILFFTGESEYCHPMDCPFETGS